MRISTRLLIAALVPLLVALVAVAGFVISSVAVSDLQAEQDQITRLRTELSDLNDFARSYLLNHDERSRRQFFAVAREIEREASTVPGDHLYRPELVEISEEVQIASSLFRRLIAMGEQRTDISPALMAEAEERLSAQIFIRIRNASGIAARLLQSIGDTIVTSERLYSIGIGLATLISAIALVAALLRARAVITGSLAQLESGTRLVGAGDLSHRIPLTTHDELGQLGRSFNQMTTELQALTVSRHELEAEVRERRRAEDRLAEALDTERESVRLAEALNRINEAVHSTLQFDEIMRRVVVDIAQALGVEAAAIQLRRNGYWVSAYNHGLPESFAQMQLSDEQVPTSMLALETRMPVVVHDTATDPRVSPEVREALDVSAYMLAPLIARDEVVGALFADRLGGATGFTEQQVDFLQKVASTVALAMENARLYEAERGIADRLQEALLALPDQVRGVEFAHAYHSATEMARVGGDFYDLFELSHDHVGIVIGDVAGKGLDAAVMTSMVKNTVRAHANERGKTPSTVLGLTNEVVYKATTSEAFVTVFFGILDCRDGRLTYANAGHTRCAILAGSGSVGRLSPTGPILGAFADAEFDQLEAWIDFDDLLFLYTDGLTEARREKEFFGEERLFDLLGPLHGEHPSAVVYRIVSEVMEFSENNLRDDLAILALTRARAALDSPQQQKLEIA